MVALILVKNSALSSRNWFVKLVLSTNCLLAPSHLMPPVQLNFNRMLLVYLLLLLLPLLLLLLPLVLTYYFYYLLLLILLRNWLLIVFALTIAGMVNELVQKDLFSATFTLKLFISWSSVVLACSTHWLSFKRIIWLQVIPITRPWRRAELLGTAEFFPLLIPKLASIYAALLNWTPCWNLIPAQLCLLLLFLPILISVALMLLAVQLVFVGVLSQNLMV